MKQKPITKKLAIQLADKIVKEAFKHHKIPFTWISKEEWENFDVKNWDNNWQLLPLFIVDDRWICCVDCGYGHDVVIDLIKETVDKAKHGIFKEEYCFVSDYYGFSDGQFYIAVNEE